MGHVGFVPRSAHTLGGSRVQGRGPGHAERLLGEARALEEAGCFSIVLELVVGTVARRISEELTVPTIGIDAGARCDGQVLVLPDALGLNPDFRPRFLKRFAELSDAGRQGVPGYIREVRDRTYPGSEHTFGEKA